MAPSASSSEHPGAIVTGAAGFIGSHLCESLLDRGWRVVGVDNFDPFYDRAIKIRNAEACAARGGARFELVDADIRDHRAMIELFERVSPETAFHLAARAGVRPSIEDPVGYASFNVVGTSAVLDAARHGGCARIVVASSSSVYGNARSVPFSEEELDLAPISPYASTKLACESMGHTHWHLTGMPTACLRFFTVYGPRQRPDLAIGRFLDAVSSGRPITMFGDGSTSRDYTYVDDVVDGIIRADERIAEHGFRIWNLGSDRPIRLDELIERIGSVVGDAPSVQQGAPQPGDVERTWADLTRARDELGYAPTTSLEDGLRSQLRWMHTTGEVSGV